MRRAEAAGFKALVLTVDAPFFGIRRDDIRNKFQLPPHLKMANFEGKQHSGTFSDMFWYIIHLNKNSIVTPITHLQV